MEDEGGDESIDKKVGYDIISRLRNHVHQMDSNWHSFTIFQKTGTVVSRIKITWIYHDLFEVDLKPHISFWYRRQSSQTKPNGRCVHAASG